MSLCHPNYPPQELSRIAANNWTIANANFAAPIAAPTGVAVAATVQPTTSTTPPIRPASYGYIVTAIDAKTGQESIGSQMAVVTNGVDISATQGSNIVGWTGVTGAVSYNVYATLANYNTNPASTTLALPPTAGSPVGFVGSTNSTQFIDPNITPDFAQVPPQHRNPFAPGQVLYFTMGGGGSGYTSSATVSITSGTGTGFSGQPVVVAGAITGVVVYDPGQNYLNTDTVVFTTGSGAAASITVGPATGTYPGVVAYFQERRAYAQTLNQPDTLFFSEPGNFLNFDTRDPSQAGDAISVTPFGQEVNGVEWLVTMPGGLVTLTGLQAWQILGPGSFGATSVQPITPSSIAAVPQAYNGTNPQVIPVVINYDIIYVQSRGSVVRDLSYNFFANIYTGTDLTILSSHLFENHQILSSAWCEEPFKVYWVVRDDFTLLSMTYLKEQEISSWSRHDTAGNVRCVASCAEPPVNALYMVVQRTYNPIAGSIYLIERMDNRLWKGAEDPWCVDSGVATTLQTPNGTLNANTASGAVTFNSGSAVFNAGQVGQTIRMGGGVATITTYTNSQTVSGTWLYPCQQTLPNYPGNIPIGQAPGAWTIAFNVTTLGGLTHLQGLQVVGLADGVPVGPLTVTTGLTGVGGFITLPFPASDVRIGLAFTPQLQTIYLDGDQPTLQGRRKTISAATFRVAQSAGLKAGTNQPDGATLCPPIVNAQWSPLYPVVDLGSTYTSPGGATVRNLFTGDLRINLKGAYRKPAQVAVEQDNPLPLNVLAVIPEFLGGDTPEAQVTPERDKQQQRQAAP